MTIIVLRDGIMAADSITTDGWTRRGAVRKIVRSKSGIVGAAAGPTAACHHFRQWLLEDDMARAFHPDVGDEGFGAILAFPDGTIAKLNAKGQRFTYLAPWYIEGVAEEVALGALALGASAVEAVKVCIEYHLRCGGPVQIEKVGAQA